MSHEIGKVCTVIFVCNDQTILYVSNCLINSFWMIEDVRQNNTIFPRLKRHFLLEKPCVMPHHNQQSFLKSLQGDKSKDLSKLKAFEDDEMSVP